MQCNANQCCNSSLNGHKVKTKIMLNKPIKQNLIKINYSNKPNKKTKKSSMTKNFQYQIIKIIMLGKIVYS